VKSLVKGPSPKLACTGGSKHYMMSRQADAYANQSQESCRRLKPTQKSTLNCYKDL